MATTTSPSSSPSSPPELGTLLPVLLDEISRLKQLHSLAGITELPVKDAVVREQLTLLRADFAQIKLLFGGAGAMMMGGSNQAPAAEAAARKDEEEKDVKAPAAFGQAVQPATPRPPTRPRLSSVANLAGKLLPLPEGCDTHFFLVSTDNRSRR